MIIQSMINCNVPGMRTIRTSTDGVVYTTQFIQGYRPFKSYISLLSALLPNSWSLRYDETADRVLFTPGTGSLAITLESDSMADLLGFSSKVIGLSSSEITSNVGPAGCCAIQKAHFSNPIPGKKPRLEVYRHGRARSVAWGGGVKYTVKTFSSYSNANRIVSGPLSSGKIRIGAWDASSIYKPTDLGGYLDGFLIGQPTIEPLQGNVESNLELDLIVISPTTAHNETEALKDPFFGNLARGYSLNFYAFVEGLPFRFCEVDPGIADSINTVSPTLIVDDSQTVQFKVNRKSGVAGASGVTLGILDPLNDLEIFSLPTFEVQVAESVEYNETSITLAAASDSLGSSGIAYLGNEALKFTGNTGASGSPANTLTGITRPYGPGYNYGLNTIQKFKTVTNKKKAWSGSTVKLHAMLLDPFGRAVDLAWDSTYSRQFGAFSLKGLPGYDSGVWVLECDDLIRRLTKPASTPVVGKVSPYDYSAIFDPLLSQTSEAGRILVNNNGATINASYAYIYAGDTYSGSFDIDLTATGGPSTFDSLSASIQYCLNAANAANVPQSTAAFGVTYSIGELTAFDCIPSEFKQEDGGSVTIQTRTIYNPGGGPKPTNFTASLVLSPKTNQASPSWLNKISVVAFFDNADETFYDTTIGFDGKTSDFVVIEQIKKDAISGGTFPSSGYVILEGETGEDGQLCEYETNTAFGTRFILGGLARIEGNPQSTIVEGKEINLAELTQGTPGAIAARMLESSGFAAGARGAFDVLGEGFGYSLEAADFINDATSGADMETSLLGAPGGLPSLRLTLGSGHSLQATIGGLLSSFGMSLSWVRVGSLLKIGIVGTGTAGQTEQFTITDNDLVAGKAGSIKSIGAGANVVKVNQSTSLFGKGGASYTYRVIEDVQSRGAQLATLDLYGLDSSNFFTIAEQAAARLADGSFAEVAYEMTVSGERDYLPGQLVRFAINYPGFWNFQTGAQGLTGLGRILEVGRSLTKNQVNLSILASGPALFSTLCPSVFVTGYNAAGPTLTVNDSSVFVDGDPIRITIPGVDNGSGQSVFQEVSIVGISGNDLTLSSALGFAPTSYTVCTFVQDDNALITDRQNSHSHVSDSSRWS